MILTNRSWQVYTNDHLYDVIGNVSDGEWSYGNMAGIAGGVENIADPENYRQEVRVDTFTTVRVDPQPVVYGFASGVLIFLLVWAFKQVRRLPMQYDGRS